MSTVVRPSGPLPPRVYWLRRLVLLVVVAAVVWGVVRMVGGGDPASGEPAGDATPTSDSTAASETDDAAAEQESKPTPRELREQRRRARLVERTKVRRSQRVREVPQTLEGPTGSCDLTLVRAVPQVPSPAYAGTSVLLRLGLRTDQADPCTIELDADRLLVSVSSVGQVVVDGVTSEATEVVWSTAQCRDAVPGRTVVLRPSWTSTVDLSWSGLRSGRRCRADRKPADAGPYRVQAAALTGEPAQVDFDLVDPLSMDRPVQARADQGDGDIGDAGQPATGADQGDDAPDDGDAGQPTTGTDQADDAAGDGDGQ